MLYEDLSERELAEFRDEIKTDEDGRFIDAIGEAYGTGKERSTVLEGRLEQSSKRTRDRHLDLDIDDSQRSKKPRREGPKSSTGSITNSTSKYDGPGFISSPLEDLQFRSRQYETADSSIGSNLLSSPSIHQAPKQLQAYDTGSPSTSTSISDPLQGSSLFTGSDDSPFICSPPSSEQKPNTTYINTIPEVGSDSNTLPSQVAGDAIVLIPHHGEFDEITSDPKCILAAHTSLFAGQDHFQGLDCTLDIHPRSGNQLHWSTPEDNQPTGGELGGDIPTVEPPSIFTEYGALNNGWDFTLMEAYEISVDVNFE